MKAKLMFLVASLFICASVAVASGNDDDEVNPFKTGRAAKIERDRAHKKKRAPLTSEQEQAQNNWRREVEARNEAKRERLERERFLREHPGVDMTPEPIDDTNEYTLISYRPEGVMISFMIIIGNIAHALVNPQGYSH